MRTITCVTLLIIVCLQAGFVSGQSRPPETVRRVVTALDATGRAVVLIDDQVPLAAPPPRNPSANLLATSSPGRNAAARPRCRAGPSVLASPLPPRPGGPPRSSRPTR